MVLSTVPTDGAVRPTESVVLTATASQDVTPTPFYIEIDDLATGRVALCATGVTCWTTVVHNDPTFTRFRARITDAQGVVVPAVSDPVIGTWLTAIVHFELNSSGQTTVRAEANLDMGPTPWWLSLWRFNGGQPVLLATCAVGTDCGAGTLDVSGERYAAVISNRSDTWSGLTGIRSIGGWFGID